MNFKEQLQEVSKSFAENVRTSLTLLEIFREATRAAHIGKHEVDFNLNISEEELQTLIQSLHAEGLGTHVIRLEDKSKIILEVDWYPDYDGGYN